MSRRALVVGIDQYDAYGCLTGCAADADAVAGLLAEHADGEVNYHYHLHTAPAGGARLTRATLRQLLVRTFADARGDVAFYFAGHGAITDTGAFLCTSDAAPHDLGVSMDEVLQLASTTRAQSVLVILDCCHSGAIGNPGAFGNALAATPLALLRQDVTLLAAARASQTAMEADGHGAFTAALLRALRGGAADVLGQVTAPAMYAYAERRFNDFEQRPTYKAHASSVAVVRRCAPAVDRAALLRMHELFPSEDYPYPLDPDYEDCDAKGQKRPQIDARKVAIGLLFKDLRDAWLVRPSTPREQLFWTAQESHTVELTHRGREYWWLVRNGLI